MTRQQQLQNSQSLHFYWSHFTGLTDPVPDFIGSPSTKIHLEPISLISFYLECMCPNKTSHIVYKNFVYFNSQEEFDRLVSCQIDLSAIGAPFVPPVFVTTSAS
jgi:hypothetical protein